MKYKTVVITGASSGLGEEFAKQMAPDAEKLVLVARRGDRLEILKEELLKKHAQLSIATEQVDLANSDELGRFATKLIDGTYITEVLINNAGLGDLGCFVNAEWSKIEAMLTVNMVVLTKLAHVVLPGMCERKRGEILNVSSLASTLPIPDFAAYAATKAYVTSFSEALRLEVQEHKVGVTALCPGPVHTEFGAVANRKPEKEKIPGSEFASIPKEQCVREGLVAMDAHRATVFPGFKIRLFKLCIALLPMPLLRLLMGRRPRRID